MISRRQFLKASAATGVGLALPWRLGLQPAFAVKTPQIPLAGSAIPQFADPVPDLLAQESLIVDNGTQIVLEMREHKVNILPTGAVPNYAGTYVWSYLKPGQAGRTSYLGPVVVVTRNLPTEMKFVNMLGSVAATNLKAYKYSTDQTLHWADPLNDGANMLAHMAGIPPYNDPNDRRSQNYDGTIPAAVHLHGGEVPPVLDGGPDSWFTSDGTHVGHGFYSKGWNSGMGPQNYCIYRYPNSGEGGLIWFHDHTLGATRLNVYCGLAGAYLITEAGDPVLGTLPPLTPLVLQDRMFDTDGQLFFPSDTAAGLVWTPNPEHPYWVPEFVGDTIVVNGKSWPYMNVEPKRYTLMFINGSNARTYELQFVDQVSKNPGPPLWMIGTDGGYLDTPVKIDPTALTNNVLAIMPGERYWAIVDFKGYEAGVVGPNGVPYSGKWLLKNNGKTPYPGGASPQGSTLGRIMQFRVAGGPVNDTTFNPALPGATLRGGTGQVPVIVRLKNSTTNVTRQLTLNEILGAPVVTTDPVTGVQNTAYPGGPMEILVNNTKWSGERVTGVTNGMYDMVPIPGFTPDPTDPHGTYFSELPNEGDTEIWEIVNLTADAHPIHLHLVQFQLLNRQGYNTNKYAKAYAAAFPVAYDYVLGANTAGGVYVPAFGPPLDYATGNARALGGNPDITPYLQGPVMPPLPQENGWKDTVMMLPGQVTRIAVRWAPTDLVTGLDPAEYKFVFDPQALGGDYVWHCHIVDHEDNEMMRPDRVTPKTGAQRFFHQGSDY